MPVLSPPAAHLDQRRASAVLRAVALVSAGAAALLGIVGRTFDWVTTTQACIAWTLLPTAAVTLLILRGGRFAGAFRAFLIGAGLAVTMYDWSEGGLYGPSMFAYVVVALSVALVWGRQRSFVAAVAICLQLLLTTALRLGGVLPEPSTRSAVMLLVFYVVEMFVVVAIVAVAVARMERALATARDAAAHLDETVQERTRMLIATNTALAAENARRRATEEQLVAARDQAEQAGRAKSAFLANMSHEIRTPMNAVIGLTDVLLLSTTDADSLDALETIRSSGAGLLRILDDILDLSKVEAGRIELENLAVAIPALIADVKALLAVRARDAGVELRCDVDAGVPPLVLLDPVRVRQVLLNLVGNALKFAPKGRVRVCARRNGAGDLRFDIEDDGLGMSNEQMARLFEPFVQGDASMTRRFGGTGLGLAICRRLIERMGGAIGCESAAGAGARFWFTLPCRPTERAVDEDSGARPAPTAIRSTLRVLVAEDNLVNQKVARKLLAHIGLEVKIVATGVEALAALRSSAFDVVMMDVQMPEMDGLEATRRIRRGEAAGKTPWIIALTANALAQDREACFAAGVDDFIAKPVNAGALRAALARVPLAT